MCDERLNLEEEKIYKKSSTIQNISDEILRMDRKHREKILFLVVINKNVFYEKDMHKRHFAESNAHLKFILNEFNLSLI